MNGLLSHVYFPRISKFIVMKVMKVKMNMFRLFVRYVSGGRVTKMMSLLGIPKCHVDGARG